MSRDTFAEFRAVLEYPKFKLTAREIKSVIEEEILPFFDVVEVTEVVRGLWKDPRERGSDALPVFGKWTRERR